MKTKSVKKNMNAMPMLTLRQMAKVIGGDGSAGPTGDGTLKEDLIKK